MAQVKQAPEKRERFLNRISVYGLEFAVAMVTIIISMVVLSIATFALFGYIADTSRPVLGQAALWVAASAIVWVPVAFIFYVRSRGHGVRHPELSTHPAQRAFVIIYQTFMMLTVISFAIAAIYSALSAAVQPQSTGDILLKVTVPSLIAAALFFGAFIAFFKRPVVGHKTYSTAFLVVSALIVLPVIIVSIVSLRGASSDTEKVQALNDARQAINQYVSEKDRGLPNSLGDVTSYVKSSEKRALDHVTYKRIDERRYQLCATFAAGADEDDERPVSAEYYSSYANFDDHGSGYQCFNLRTTSYDLY